MFTWICPKCGKEVPPAYPDCPNCAATSPAKPPAAAADEPPPLPPYDAPAAPPAAAAPTQPARATQPVPKPGGVRIPAFLLVLISAVLIVVAGAGAVLLLRKSPDAATPPAAAVPAASRPALEPVPQQQVAAFKDVELSGLRLSEDNAHKPVLQFFVVNHSGADLGDIGAKVNLKAISGKPDQQLVGEFSFKVVLGPYEAKELKVPVKTNLRVYELPDWQFLRAEIVP